MAGTRQTLGVSFRSSSLRESRSNCRLTSTSLSYLRRSSASAQISPGIITGQGGRESAPAGVYTGILHPTSPHAPSSHDPTQVNSANTQLPSSLSRYSFKHDRPPSSVRSKPISSSGPSSSSVDAPTMTQCPYNDAHYSPFTLALGSISSRRLRCDLQLCHAAW